MLKFEVGYLGLFDYIFWNLFLKIVFYFLIQKHFLKIWSNGSISSFFFFKKKGENYFLFQFIFKNYFQKIIVKQCLKFVINNFLFLNHIIKYALNY